MSTGLRRDTHARLMAALATLTAITFVLSLCLGSTDFSIDRILQLLAGHGSDMEKILVVDLRLPRAINAFLTGALLALSGALMQTLLRNPLADPYILGLSGGSSTGALLAIYLGLGSFWISANAVLGAFAAIYLVLLLAGARANRWDRNRLLLTGVVIASGWGAMINLLLTITPDSTIKHMLFWLVGDLSFEPVRYGAMATLLAGGLIAWLLARPLDISLGGEEQALALGVNTQGLRRCLFMLCSALTATAVVTAGSIGFIGLIVPHILRLVGGSSHRWLLPACVLAGGSLLMLADTLARTVIAPEQLPVGVITAAIGVPVFVVLLHRHPHGR